jgi:hypothetical protein
LWELRIKQTRQILSLIFNLCCSVGHSNRQNSFIKCAHLIPNYILLFFVSFELNTKKCCQFGCFSPWFHVLYIILFAIYGQVHLKRRIHRHSFPQELIPLPSLHRRAIFISGCDSGFGRLLAIRCARNGILTFAGCLTSDGQQQIQSDVDKLGVAKDRLVTVPLDVTNDESVREAADFVAKHLPQGHQLWALVNNAGVLSCYGPDAWTTIEEFEWGIDRV